MPQSNRIDRRKALAVVATAPVAIALSSPAFALGEPGQLASLVWRYFAEVDVFNATDHPTDEASDAHAEATYEATLRKMVGLPARTAEDALAALDWLIKERADFESELGDDGLWGRVVTSLVDALRGYVARRAS